MPDRTESYDYDYPLGKIGGKTIYLAVDYSDRVTDDAGAVTDDYAVWLFFWSPGENAEDAEQVHIVRIDDRKHGGPHIDRFYSEEGGKDTSLPGGFDVEDAIERLEGRWEHYARQYRDNFGFE